MSCWYVTQLSWIIIHGRIVILCMRIMGSLRRVVAEGEKCLGRGDRVDPESLYVPPTNRDLTVWLISSLSWRGLWSPHVSPWAASLQSKRNRHRSRGAQKRLLSIPAGETSPQQQVESSLIGGWNGHTSCSRFRDQPFMFQNSRVTRKCERSQFVRVKAIPQLWWSLLLSLND